MACLPPLRLLMKACCLGRGRWIKVLTADGRWLRFEAPAIAKQVLMDYPGHALVRSDSASARPLPLPPTCRLHPRHLYLLLPQPAAIAFLAASASTAVSPQPPSSSSSPSSAASRGSSRRVSFAADQAAAAGSNSTRASVELLPSPSDGVLRLKMVVSKKQLACLLQNGGDCSSMVKNLLSPSLREADGPPAAGTPQSYLADGISSWTPSLSSIPETAL